MKASKAICSGVAIVLTCAGVVWFFFGPDSRTDPGEQATEQGATPITDDHRPPVAAVPIVPERRTRGHLLADAAMGQVGTTTTYDSAYVRLDYPGGDVPMDRGVCTDVVVRALRKLGVDLQVLIHEDMTASFKSYPDLWGLRRPDRNIDHRRVPNIARYLHRKGKAVPITQDPENYLPGDIVVWRLSDGRLHMGIVSDTLVAGTPRHMIVHNMGAGARQEDHLFSFKIAEHFRYF